MIFQQWDGRRQKALSHPVSQGDFRQLSAARRGVKGQGWGVSDENAVAAIAPPSRLNVKAANPPWAECCSALRRADLIQSLRWFLASILLLLSPTLTK